jgi:hypothetical protein
MDVAVECSTGGGFALDRDRVFLVGRKVTACKISDSERPSYLGAGNFGAHWQLVPGEVKGGN